MMTTRHLGSTSSAAGRFINGQALTAADFVANFTFDQFTAVMTIVHMGTYVLLVRSCGRAADFVAEFAREQSTAALMTGNLDICCLCGQLRRKLQTLWESAA